MPAKWFICPDGERVLIVECLAEGGCRRGNRCATRSYLTLASRDRVWSGVPSTTQLIGGTMLAWLRLTRQYAISPDSRAFMVLGTKAHKALEIDDPYSLTEERFDGAETPVTGIMDVLEVENGKSILSDYKTAGSYKVMKALGWYIQLEETDGVYKSGPRKGEKRTRKVLRQDDSKIDRLDWELQLNNYRIECEKRDFAVDEMRVMCIVRDGGTHIAHSRGVMRNIYYFRINKLPDKDVLEYFNRKRISLVFALKYGWKYPCTESENWGGIRCERYCEVAEFCPLGKYLITRKRSMEVPINGLSEQRWLPRDGKIRLGIKKVSAKTGKEYPAEVDYFVLDPATADEGKRVETLSAFHALYGEQPKSIEIMFPSGERLSDGDYVVFPQNYARYGKGSGLKCKGDGVTAMCMSPEYAAGLEKTGELDGLVQVQCRGADCKYQKSRECTRHATLQVFLPRLKGAGVWQINTSSILSILNINSDLEHLLNIVGRFHMLYKASNDTYLRLTRVPTQITHDGKAQTHYPLKVDMGIALSDLTYMAKLEAAAVMAALPPADDASSGEIPFDDVSEDDVTDDAVPDGGGVAPISAAPPPARSSKGGITFETLVSDMAGRLGIDDTVFAKFAEEAAGGKGKATIGLKAAADSEKAFEALKESFTAWIDETASEAADNTTMHEEIEPSTLENDADNKLADKIARMTKKTPMKTCGTNAFKQWAGGILGVQVGRIASLTADQQSILVTELKGFTGESAQTQLEI